MPQPVTKGPNAREGQKKICIWSVKLETAFKAALTMDYEFNNKKPHEKL